MDKEIHKILLKDAIRLVVGGFLFDGGDITEIPEFLREIAAEYQRQINKALALQRHL